jgi:hypothetical protein
MGRAVHREKVAVALALNRADWLAEIGYTFPKPSNAAVRKELPMILQVAYQLAERE